MVSSETRRAVNAELKRRGYPSIPGSTDAEVRAADKQVEADSRPMRSRDERTPEQIMHDQLRQRGFPVPGDAA